MCPIVILFFGGALGAVTSKPVRRPILKQAIKGGIVVKRKAEAAGRKAYGEVSELVAESQAELGNNEETN